ncbi:MAG: hypothetical protein GY925_15700 [Actinomycetia bacterium]|nr:hypothetical protein [Actinomycetes bacterium]
MAASDREENAYAMLLLGRRRRAQRSPARPFFPTDNRAFVEDERSRRAQILSLVEARDIDGALAFLRAWRDFTASALRVE